MQFKLGFAVFATFLGICGAFAQTSSAKTTGVINGVWRGQMGDVPVLTLVVSDEPGSMVGAIQFYFLKRTTENSSPIAEPRPPEPIFDPHWDGKTLVFEVSHRRAHPPESLSDLPKHYRLTLTGPDTAEIINLDEPGSPTLKLNRSNY